MPNTEQKEYSKRAVYDYFNFLKGRKVLSMTICLYPFRIISNFCMGKSYDSCGLIFFFFQSSSLESTEEESINFAWSKVTNNFREEMTTRIVCEAKIQFANQGSEYGAQMAERNHGIRSFVICNEIIWCNI